MEKRTRGFTLVEILVVMALLSIIIMIGSETFTAIIKGTKREAGSTISQIETTLALNIIRYDVEHAGYGLYEKVSGSITYREAEDPFASLFNDSPSGIPRPLISGNNLGLNDSDRLVIKSVLSGLNKTCVKWSYVRFGMSPKTWDHEKIKIKDGERVIVIKPGTGQTPADELIVAPDGSFFTIFNSSGLGADFSPKKENETYVLYGIDPDTDLRMPFNRTDYFIRRPSSGLPEKCAPNTGILYKANVNHGNGKFTYMPIMDCVGDFQVIFGIDSDGNGTVDTYVDDISSENPFWIRQKVKEVRVYILSHEGKKDKDFRFNQERIYVGEFNKGHEFNLPQIIGEGWQNYRWRVYSIVIRPRNM